MKAVIIGAGRMAEAVLYDFVNFARYEHVTLADADPARAEDLARRRGEGKAAAAQLDAGDEAAAAAVIAGHDVCVSAAPYRYNVTLARAAVAAGAHFVDMGGNNDVVAAELALDAEAREAGVAIIPDMGLAPGMTNVLAAGLISRLDTADRVTIRVGGLPRNAEPPLGYALVFSPYGLINEYAEPCLVLRGGDVATLPPLTDVEEFDFPPVGRVEAFNTSGGTSTLPLTYGGRVRDLDYKTIRYPGHCAKIKPLFDLGLADEREISIGGVAIRPRDVFAERLVASLPEGKDDLVLVRCRAAGTAAGADKTFSYELVDYADGPSGLTAMQRTTGFPVAVAATLLAEDKINKAGACPPEVAVEPGPFVEALRERGLDIVEREE
jgi:lysine 6-dehydrogenase